MFFGMFIGRGVRKTLLHLENRIAAIGSYTDFTDSVPRYELARKLNSA